MDDTVVLFQIRRTVVKMLSDRGYAVPQEELDMSKDRFREAYGDFPTRTKLTQNWYYPHQTQTGAASQAVEEEEAEEEDKGEEEENMFLDEETRKQRAKEREEREESRQERAAKDSATSPNGVFVFWPEEAKPGVSVLKPLFQKMMDKDVRSAILIVRVGLTPTSKKAVHEMAVRFKMECFTEKELMVNITEHKLVPRHVLLSDKQRDRLLSKYKLRVDQLPQIKESDPVARYYALQKGQVVKIIRDSPTSGTYVTYRLVI
ncbi:DNA-directed RNA polymerases I, II, and III subunit RPABC1 [Balamuthia mandrillaris]